MSSTQVGLHGDALLTALTRTATEVQRARKVEDAVRAVGGGLEALGFRVLVLCAAEGSFVIRYLTDDAAMQALANLKALGPHRRVELGPDSAMARVTGQEAPFLIPGFRRRARAFLGERPEAEAFLGKLPDLAAASALRVRECQWGALVVMHEDLRDDDLPALRLFSLQVGSALEVAEAFERLERRTAELDLVHELAVAGPRADSRALCRRALETVCLTTGSDGGTLHRYDADAEQYALVGDAFGYEGPLVEGFRRFSAPRPGAVEPLAGPSSALPLGGDLLEAEGFSQIAIVPLRIEGKPVGLLSLGRRAEAPYLPSELRSAEILGVQMASLLERARLYDESARLYADLKKSYDELARTQQELVRHERLAALGELAAVMAHEVRNPLGVIFNSLTTIKRLMRPEGDAEMLLSIVGEEADRLNRIVGDLLDFVRPYELVKKPLAVEPVVTSAVDAATQATAPHNVRVVTDFPKELPPFPLDAHLLKQALVNLIVNAAQAMPRGGTVQVRATMEPRGDQAWLALVVRDEGVGLTPRAAEKMFQPFFTTKATGTGLGLAVVKRIVDAHLGEISARPNEGGQGTSFVVRLPPTPETRSGVATPPRPAPSAPRR